MADWTDLKAFVGAPDADDAFVTSCWDSALSLVTDFIGTGTVPTVIKDRATLNVGSELYHQRNAPNGIAQFASFDGTPIRVARDPMVAAIPLLSRYLVIGL